MPSVMTRASPHLPLHRVRLCRRCRDAVLYKADAHDPWRPQLLRGCTEGVLLKVEACRCRCGDDLLRCIGRLQHTTAVGAVQHPPHLPELVLWDVLLRSWTELGHGGRTGGEGSHREDTDDVTLRTKCTTRHNTKA